MLEGLSAPAIISTIVYAVLGVAIGAAVFMVIDLMTPGKLHTYLTEKNNTSVAIVIAAIILGIAIIVAASVHG